MCLTDQVSDPVTSYDSSLFHPPTAAVVPFSLQQSPQRFQERTPWLTAGERIALGHALQGAAAGGAGGGAAGSTELTRVVSAGVGEELIRALKAEHVEAAEDVADWTVEVRGGPAVCTFCMNRYARTVCVCWGVQLFLARLPQWRLLLYGLL